MASYKIGCNFKKPIKNYQKIMSQPLRRPDAAPVKMNNIDKNVNRDDAFLKSLIKQAEDMKTYFDLTNAPVSNSI